HRAPRDVPCFPTRRSSDLKPSRGRTSLGPDAGEGWGGLSVEHVVARSVRDTAAVLDAVAGYLPGDPYSAPPPARPFRDEVGSPPDRKSTRLNSSHVSISYA